MDSAGGQYPLKVGPMCPLSRSCCSRSWATLLQTMLHQSAMQLSGGLLDAHVAGLVRSSKARARVPARAVPSLTAALLSIRCSITCWVVLPRGFDRPQDLTTGRRSGAAHQAGRLPQKPRQSSTVNSRMQSQSQRKETMLT